MSDEILNKLIQRAANLPPLELDTWPKFITENAHKLGAGLSVPTLGIITNLMIPVQLTMAHSSVMVEETHWKEPVIVWLVDHMSTGTGKSSVAGFTAKLNRLVDRYVLKNQ